MSVETISAACNPNFVSTIPFSPTLSKSLLDEIQLSNDLERQLRALTVEHRKVKSFNFMLLNKNFII